VLAEQGLVESVVPIQLAIRLLIPAGSRLLELPDVRELVAPFDEAGLVYPWRHDDRRVDALADDVQAIVQRSEKLGRTRAQSFERIWGAAQSAAELDEAAPPEPVLVSRAAIPYLTEPWYC
jgi:hypothetical protein